jgi:hypothetical protein
MARRLKQAALVFVLVIVAAQFVQPARTNPPTDASRTIRAQVGTSNGLVAVLDRSCSDCHSNETVWPRAARITPLSWVMAQAVAEGRKALNFSEWTAYSPAQQQTLLAASCDDATAGKMPGIYTWFRPETRLAPRDIETICTAARQAEARTAGLSR